MANIHISCSWFLDCSHLSQVLPLAGSHSSLHCTFYYYHLISSYSLSDLIFFHHLPVPFLFYKFRLCFISLSPKSLWTVFISLALNVHLSNSGSKSPRFMLCHRNKPPVKLEEPIKTDALSQITALSRQIFCFQKCRGPCIRQKIRTNQLSSDTLSEYLQRPVDHWLPDSQAESLYLTEFDVFHP